MHSHGAIEGTPRASRRVSLALAAVVGAIVLATGIGAAALWPQGDTLRGSVELDAEGVTRDVVTVEEVDGPTVVVSVDDTGELVTLEQLPYPSFEIYPGDRVSVYVLPTGQMIFSDFERSSPILWLAIAYVALVVVIARWRGLGALLGLVGAFGVIAFFTVPALFSGSDPLWVAMVTGSGALFALLYLAHGVNARTSTAYLGTLAGLSMTAALAAWAVPNSHLVGMADEDAQTLSFYDSDLSLSGLVLAGIVIAGLGILNDVTITQASAVWELRAARPDAGRWTLFASGMRIGRDHIASTVYTIAFAYAGAALPTLMLLSIYDAELLRVLTASEIAEEVVRTLVGSIGLVLAVPLTTAIAAIVASSGPVWVKESGAPQAEDATGAEGAGEETHA